MQVEGIPEGYELVRIGKPKPGEWRIDGFGEVRQCSEIHDAVWPVVRETRKHTELILMLGRFARNSGFSFSVLPDRGELVPIRLIESGFPANNEMPDLDLIEVVFYPENSPTEPYITIALGHWNDGPKENEDA